MSKPSVRRASPTRLFDALRKMRRKAAHVAVLANLAASAGSEHCGPMRCMRGTRIVATAFAALVPLLAILASDASADSSIPACMSVATDARYVPYGYNHVVVLKNGCSKPATCNVSTDVNPKSTTVEVASASTVEVLTFTASPAQTFNAFVSCKLH